MRAHEAKKRIQLVHIPIGFDARGILPHAPTSNERGLPSIACSRVHLRDAHKRAHIIAVTSPRQQFLRMNLGNAPSRIELDREGGEGIHSPSVMKRAFTIALILLASGGVGRAVVLCARSLCAMPLVRCCCHRPGELEPARLVSPMACEASPGTLVRSWRDVGARPCCLLPSASARASGEAISTSPPLQEREGKGSVDVVPNGTSPPVKERASSDDLFSVAPPIYLRFAVLRI